jgi:hypothetical protein
MNSRSESAINRRSFFSRVGTSMHGAGLAWLLSRDLFAGSGLLSAETDTRRAYNLQPQFAQFEPKAKAVIQLFMQGGPSQMDLLDPKPQLDQLHGESYFGKVVADLTGPEQAGTIFRSPFKYTQHGQSGLAVSSLLPRLAEVVDDIAVIRSMFTTHPNHEPAIFKFQSGRIIQGLPTLGSWVVYGLGSESQNLPAFVVLPDPNGLPINGVQNWQAGLLPPVYQGTQLRSTGSPLLNLTREIEQPPEVAQFERDLLARLDRIHQRKRPGYLQLDARINSYQLAAQMQMKATNALDLAQESDKTLAMYGVGGKKSDNFARRCLMARRLVERGVRFIQISTSPQIWDNHNNIVKGITDCCAQTDQPVAALLKDLKQRGLLDSTLVLWGGEFGRMPISQLPDKTNSGDAGRDHNPRGFTVWMAGGGVKGGTVYGTTDELGYEAEENPVSVTDWHATILHLLGLHHDELFFDHNGLEEKLTSVFNARVVKEIIA